MASVSKTEVDTWRVRSGWQISTRKLNFKNGPIDGYVEFGSFEVPLVYEYMLSDKLYAGLGGRFNFAMTSKCKANIDCTAEGIKGFYLFTEADFGYMISNNWDVTGFYQYGIGDIYDGAGSPTVIGLRLTYYFDKDFTKQIKKSYNVSGSH